MTLAALTASIEEHGDHVYITCPVSLYEPEQAEIETFAFASDLRSAAPNPKILWLRGQYVQADEANDNSDQWTAGELAIKALTPVLMPITVMHDLRSAVGTIADAKLLTPEKDQVPRARIDTTLALWEHRFPEVAEEARVNASQGTLMQSMECLSPYYDCSVCGKMHRRGPEWKKEWREHVASHPDYVASGGRSPARILRNVTFTGVGLVFGTRGAKGAMPSAHLEVEELAAMHREAHDCKPSPKSKRPRRKNFMEIEDTKYEGMVAAKAESDSKVTELTARLQETERKLEETEAAKVKAEEEREAEKKRANAAEELQRVGAMKDERLAALGTGFRAKLDKLETTAKKVGQQAGEFSEEQWEERVAELEETLGVKRDAKLDEEKGDDGKGGKEGKEGKEGSEATAGLLFDRKDVVTSGLGGKSEEVTASASDDEPSVSARQSVMAGLVRPRKKTETAKA